jgi:hypothetical protein
VNDAHREAIADGTQHYVELSRAYLEKGFARAFPAPDDPLGITPPLHGPVSAEEWRSLLERLAKGGDRSGS